MTRIRRLAPAVALAAFTWGGPVQAQYMYLDVNGDQISDATDVLTPATLSVDVWLDTDSDGDGSPETCPQSANALTINSYEVITRATGALTYGAWTDNMGYTGVLGNANAGTDFYVGRSGNTLSPGLYKLGSLALSGVASGAVLSIVSRTSAAPSKGTMFGTQCEGSDFDNTYKLDYDWFDVAGTYAPANINPVIVVPATASGSENTPFSVTATASDADAGNTVRLSQTNNSGGFLPSPTSNGPVALPSLTVSGTPNFSRAGSYTVSWTAADNTTGTAAASTIITITNTNQKPVISAPATASGAENSEFNVTGSASNADAQYVTLYQTNDAPFLTASSSAGPVLVPSITLTGTPNFTQSGTYTVNWTAVDENIPAETAIPMATVISIANRSRPPALDDPADMTVNEGSMANQQLVASDPDGDPLTFGKVGTTPTFMSVSASGLVTVAPGFLDAGSYSTAQVSVTDGTQTVSSSMFQILVINTNRPPTVVAPVSTTTFESTPIAFVVSAADPDGDTVRLFVVGLPLGATFTDTGGGSGSFMWTPGYSQAGTYSVGFLARDSQGAIGPTHVVEILVGDLNRAPTAAAGGPYAGIVNVPITFNGTGSSDPDGSPLSYLWTFGDLATATGVTPLHSYASGGTFTVTLAVGDGSLSASASTIATIQDVFPARAFTTGGNGTIRLGSGKATWCTQIEPVSGGFLNTSVIPSTITMKYGAGQILAQAGKVSIGADKDANGVDEITACFAKTDLRTLFTGLPKGTNTVTVTLEGDLETGGRFRGDLTVDVVSTGGTLVASLSPNPLNPEGTLTLRTEREGALRVTVFDLSGRVVRILHDGSRVAAGYHDMRIDGRDGSGRRLPSGVYFYRVEAAEGVETGRFVIAK